MMRATTLPALLAVLLIALPAAAAALEPILIEPAASPTTTGDEIDDAAKERGKETTNDEPVAKRSKVE